MPVLQQELKRRLGQMFAALARGEDVPPGAALRAEGMMEAALLSGAAGQAELDALIGDSYRAAWGKDIETKLGQAWRDMHPFPQIPVFMQRAPVFPSTAD